jgi:cytosine/adenosine deaminase-related metal-dependent hydrolase
MHLSEGDFEPKYALQHFGKLPVQYYEDLSILGPHVLASQCVKLQPQEMDILAARKVRVAHMPLSNCEVGGGIAPVPELLDREVTVSLGSDGYINNFFEVMRGAFLIHKASHEDPRVMPARLVWRMATEFGAIALGWPELGRLEVGRPADLIVVEADTPTPVERHNIFDQLVLYRNPQDVKKVMVGGRLLKDDGRVLTLDYEDVRRHVAEAVQKLWQGAR